MRLYDLIPVWVGVCGRLFLADGAIATSSPSGEGVPGSCDEMGCDELLQTLSENWPAFDLSCEGDRILSLQVYEHRRGGRRVLLACWDTDVSDDGERDGSPLITLPFPGESDRFLAGWPDSQSYAEELSDAYPEEIQKVRFRCATYSGDIDISVSEERGEADLQCYFQAGVSLVDADGDYVSDGENSRGASVDRILGTFPLP